MKPPAYPAERPGRNRIVVTVDLKRPNVEIWHIPDANYSGTGTGGVGGAPLISISLPRIKSMEWKA